MYLLVNSGAFRPTFRLSEHVEWWLCVRSSPHYQILTCNP